MPMGPGYYQDEKSLEYMKNMHSYNIIRHFAFQDCQKSGGGCFNNTYNGINDPDFILRPYITGTEKEAARNPFSALKSPPKPPKPIEPETKENENITESHDSFIIESDNDEIEPPTANSLHPYVKRE